MKNFALLLILALSLTACQSKTTDDVSKDNAQIVSETQTEVAEVETQQTQASSETETEAIADIEAVDETEDSSENGDAADSNSEYTNTAQYTDGEEIYLDSSWKYADYSQIHSGCAVMYKATSNRKNIVVGVNAGHGTSGGSSVKTLCHPDGSAKVTGGTTSAGSTKAVAVSGGMSFNDGTAESTVTLRMAQILRDKLLSAGYDVLMVRDGSDVQLDNVARTVICNNVADCHIALHWDGDGLSYDKGCFYISVPDGIKNMEPVASHWQQHNALGSSLIEGLRGCGAKINGSGSMAIDLTQTSYSTIPSVDLELGNACSSHTDSTLSILADGIVAGVESYF